MGCWIAAREVHCAHEGCGSTTHISCPVSSVRQSSGFEEIGMACVQCGKPLSGRKQITFCSNACQSQHKFNLFIERWKKGEEKGFRGENKALSKHVRKYMLQRENYSCQMCGWNKRHPVDGLPLVEVDHVDGNAENTMESNLRVLCPNCHSMTDTFRRRNTGSKRLRS